MKLISLQENLEKALSLINRTATAKTQLPLTTNVLLKATKKGIEIVGTDLENTTQVSVAGKVEKEGGILVPTRTLIETIGAFPKEQIHIEANGLSATVKSGRYQVKLNGIAPEEFPQPPTPDSKEKVAIGELLVHIKQVAFAAAPDEARAVLTGVLVIFQKENAALVATDGYRLSLAKVKPLTLTTGTIIVPARVLTEIAKILHEKGKSEDEIEESFLVLSQAKNQVAFLLGDVVIFTRLIEGEFPAYEKIIPQNSTTKAVFDKEELLKAVKLSSIFARESANIVKIKITENGIILSANAPQVGENICEVEARVSGDENEIAFNSRFLLEFLQNVETKEIALEMTGPLNPAVFKIPGDDSYLHIIMPVRVQQ